MQYKRHITLDNLHQDVPGNYYSKAIAKNIFQKIWHTRRFNEVKKFLKYIEANTILDIGCHGGTFTNILYQKFKNSKINGIDISKQAILFARKTYPNIKFQVSRAENLPFKENSFDLITCFEVLEHIENPQTIMDEITRVLGVDGQLLIMVPTENFIFRIIWFFWTKIGPGHVWKHTHIQKFQNKKLDKLLIKNKFSITKRRQFLFGMLLLILARKKNT
jgi:2-polyprenyl-3-methyl-5-hydroxy-6-metoxy-1,4-benzoquinol methylase